MPLMINNSQMKLSERQYLLVNALMFQLGWLLCVLFGSMIAVGVTAATVALHMQWVRDKRREGIFLLLCLGIGFMTDLLLIQFGVLTTGSVFPPLWLSCLWVLFGTTVGYALRIFHGKLWLCIAAGGLSAPLSYYGGARLADVGLLAPAWLALLVIGLVWAFVFPVLIHFYSVNRLKVGSVS
ncbi:DUF2878 domain-containing protein [Pseudohongiella spirulinae]|uniref:DUF2878 domain-containing protein n=1 Tax=Pseudohongiella spirulinae TaxID=1249552 RepID=A0A0S2K9N7_9GAMM|nr:DUF2878 domain-containing protein [Pseudohongiella spirulinae]ALO45053.1 hypothetical protein PS2015_364 [Pseudohongiella spirulinae]